MGWFSRLFDAFELASPKVPLHMVRIDPPIPDSEEKRAADRERAKEAQWFEDRRIKRAAAEEELARLVEEDNAAAEAAKSYVPEVTRKRYETGDFLCYEGNEWPVRYIVGIDITSRGERPYIDEQAHYLLPYSAHARPAWPAEIGVHLFDRRTDGILIDRHCATALLEALLVAWKGEPL